MKDLEFMDYIEMASKRKDVMEIDKVPEAIILHHTHIPLVIWEQEEMSVLWSYLIFSKILFIVKKFCNFVLKPWISFLFSLMKCSKNSVRIFINKRHKFWKHHHNLNPKNMSQVDKPYSISYHGLILYLLNTFNIGPLTNYFSLIEPH